jgi:hypothetical protein
MSLDPNLSVFLAHEFDQADLHLREVGGELAVLSSEKRMDGTSGARPTAKLIRFIEERLPQWEAQAAGARLERQCAALERTLAERGKRAGSFFENPYVTELELTVALDDRDERWDGLFLGQRTMRCDRLSTYADLMAFVEQAKTIELSLGEEIGQCVCLESLHKYVGAFRLLPPTAGPEESLFREDERLHRKRFRLLAHDVDVPGLIGALFERAFWAGQSAAAKERRRL